MSGEAPATVAVGTVPSVERGDPFALARRLKTAIWVFDPETCRVIHANDAACAVWRAKDEVDLCARDISAELCPGIVARLSQYQDAFLSCDASFREVWTLYPAGVPVHLLLWFCGFPLPDGRLALQVEVIGEANLDTESQRSVEALMHTDVLVMLFAIEGQLLYANPAAQAQLPGPLTNFTDMFVDRADHVLMMFELDRAKRYREIAQVRTAIGTCWYDISAKLCTDAATGNTAVVVTANDVTALKTARDQARFNAERDQLTGCFNRLYLKRYFERRQRHEKVHGGLLCFDVDRFKSINDTFGHHAGDTVLKAITERAQHAVGQNALIARLGGDEFVILVDPITSEANFQDFVEALRRSITQPVCYGDTQLKTTISLGATLFDQQDRTLETVLRRADIALYESKQNGRDRCSFFTQALGEAVAARERFEADLQRALNEDEFLLHFQPRIDLRSREVVSAEALLRWAHPVRGLLLPADFLPTCEETGLIHALGRKVLEMAATQVRQWDLDGRNLGLSLNVSSRQFDHPKFPELLGEIAERPDVPHDRIELEISENLLLGGSQKRIRELNRITGLGYRLAIDDFGAGYSSLSHITRVPLQSLKIDRSFLRQLPASAPIVELILSLAEQLNATAVAEGVETSDQIEWLAERDCQQVQGYLMASAMPADAFEAVLDKASMPP